MMDTEVRRSATLMAAAAKSAAVGVCEAMITAATPARTPEPAGSDPAEEPRKPAA